MFATAATTELTQAQAVPAAAAAAPSTAASATDTSHTTPSLPPTDRCAAAPPHDASAAAAISSSGLPTSDDQPPIEQPPVDESPPCPSVGQAFLTPEEVSSRQDQDFSARTMLATDSWSDEDASCWSSEDEGVDSSGEGERTAGFGQLAMEGKELKRLSEVSQT